MNKNPTTTKASAPETEKLERELEQVTAQRDELLAACKLALRAGITYGPDGIKAVAALQIAIAKAEGSK